MEYTKEDLEGNSRKENIPDMLYKLQEEFRVIIPGMGAELVKYLPSNPLAARPDLDGVIFLALWVYDELVELWRWQLDRDGAGDSMVPIDFGSNLHRLPITVRGDDPIE